MVSWLQWEALRAAGLAAGKLGQYAQQEALLRHALKRAEEAHGADSIELGTLLLDLADCFEKTGKDEEAEFINNRARILIIKQAKRLGYLTDDDTGKLQNGAEARVAAEYN